MNQQTPLSEWLAGFFDGEGSVETSIRKSESIDVGYQCHARARLQHNYVGGLFDAEGSIVNGIGEMKRLNTKHHFEPSAFLDHNYNDELIELLEQYSDEAGFESHVYHFQESSEDRKPTFGWRIMGVDNVEIFLKSIRSICVVKRPQIDIMLNEIIPRMKRKDHLNKRGFLKIIAWKDQMDCYKGGRRGKYTLDYFQDLWGMSLSHDELPDYDAEQGVA